MGIRKVKGVHTIPQDEHVDVSNSKRVISGGLIAEAIHSTVATAVLVGEEKHLLVTNIDSTTVYYITVGASSIAAPGATTGIPVPPNSQLVICTGQNEYVRSNHASLHVVVMAE